MLKHLEIKKENKMVRCNVCNKRLNKFRDDWSSIVVKIPFLNVPLRTYNVVHNNCDYVNNKKGGKKDDGKL